MEHSLMDGSGAAKRTKEKGGVLCLDDALIDDFELSTHFPFHALESSHSLKAR